MSFGRSLSVTIPQMPPALSPIEFAAARPETTAKKTLHIRPRRSTDVGFTLLPGRVELRTALVLRTRHPCTRCRPNHARSMPREIRDCVDTVAGRARPKALLPLRFARKHTDLLVGQILSTARPIVKGASTIQPFGLQKSAHNPGPGGRRKNRGFDGFGSTQGGPASSLLKPALQ